jgi:hypothetical protein
VTRPTFQQNEASLKPLVEPCAYTDPSQTSCLILKVGLAERRPNRLSPSTSQMLIMLREIPTPPRSYAGSEGRTTSLLPATPGSAIRQVRRSSGSSSILNQTTIHSLIDVQQ